MAQAPPAGGVAMDRRLRGLFALVWTVFSAFLPFFVLWLRDRGMSPSQIGLVLSSSALVGVVAAPLWSNVADRRSGTVRALQVAFASSAVVAVGLAFTGSSFVAILVVAGLLAITQSPQTPLTDALAMGTLGADRLREYGSFRLWASAGWGVGAIAFGALLQVAGLRAMLPVYATGLALCALYVRLFPNVRPGRGAPGASRFGSLGEALTQVPRLPLFLFGVFLFGASTRAAWDYVPLRIVSGGGGAFLVGLAAGLSAFVEIPLMRSSSSLMERFGMRGVFAAGAAAYALASLGWAIVRAPLGVTAIRIAIGIGFGLVYVTLVVMTGTLVPERLRNTGQTLLTVSSWGLAPVLGSLVGGLVYQHLGPTKLFLGSAVGIAIGATIVWLATSGLRAVPREDDAAEAADPSRP